MDIVAFGETKLVGEKRASYFLSKKLDYNYVDCTSNDTGPQGIFRNTTKYITSNTNPFLAIIGWSNPYSLELRKFYNRTEVTGFIDENYFSYNAKYKKLPTDFSRLKRFDNILFDHHLCNNRWTTIAFSLQQTLENLNIPYMMYNIDHSIEWNGYTMRILREINRRRYIGVENPKANVVKYLKKRGLKFDTNEGQKHLANLISEKLGKIK